jgi:hypothetical protein
MFIRHRTHLLALALLMPLAACGGGEPSDDPEAIREELSEMGTMELMEKVEEYEYAEPADEKLTEKQVEMYVEVARRAQKIREVSRQDLEKKGEEKRGGLGGFMDAVNSLGDLADYTTAGYRAAIELGENPREYEWVRNQIFATYAFRAISDMNTQMNTQREELRRQLEAQRESLPEEQRAMLDEQIRNMETSADEQNADLEEKAEQEAMKHNLRLVDEHRDAIEAAMQPEERSQVGAES